MIVILKDYGKTCLCVWKSDTNPTEAKEHFIAGRGFIVILGIELGCQIIDVSADVEETKLLEHSKVLIK